MQSKQSDLKLLFSFVSLLLMIPPLINLEANYYISLFIFLINRVIDCSCRQKLYENMFMMCWTLLNQLAGIIVCALAFCFMTASFVGLFSQGLGLVNKLLFFVAASYVLKETADLVIDNFKVEKIKRINAKGWKIGGEK